MPRLIFKLHDGEEIIHDLGRDREVIGRGPASDIPLPDESVSTRHAMVELVGKKYHITDLHSTNGTDVNNRSVTDSVLEHGDHLVVGEIDCMFQEDDDDPVDFDGIEELQADKRIRKAKEKKEAAKKAKRDKGDDEDGDEDEEEDEKSSRSSKKSKSKSRDEDDDEEEDKSRKKKKSRSSRDEDADDGDDAASRRKKRLSSSEGKAGAVSSRARSQRRATQLRKGSDSGNDGCVWLIWGALAVAIAGFIGLTLKHKNETGSMNFLGDFIEGVGDNQEPEILGEDKP